MKIVCISASNIDVARQNSASTHACELIRDLVRETSGPAVEVDILPLIDAKLKPCRMCGKCLATGKCSHDKDFNRIYEQLESADAVFVVCPHYAPLPSKMMILLEKMEEICYLNWCQNHDYHTIVFNKPIGLVAHGGQTAEALPYYKTALLDPLAAAFASIQMRVVGVDEQWSNGVTFGIKNLSLSCDSIFVYIEHDWGEIRQRLTPLVNNVLAQISA
jgi:multimeric flavodoxin WrbA